jgi:hypothetical protein
MGRLSRGMRGGREQGWSNPSGRCPRLLPLTARIRLARSGTRASRSSWDNSGSVASSSRQWRWLRRRERNQGTGFASPAFRSRRRRSRAFWYSALLSHPRKSPMFRVFFTSAGQPAGITASSIRIGNSTSRFCSRSFARIRCFLFRLLLPSPASLIGDGTACSW